MSKVVVFSNQVNFINSLVEFTDNKLLKNGYSLEKILFVFGGQRPILFLKHAFLRKFGKSYISPKLFSMEEFIDFILDESRILKPVIKELDACWLIYQLANKYTKGIVKSNQTFADFLPWAKQIISFIEQLDLEDVDNQKLFTIQNAADIGYDVPDSINDILRHCATLRDSFHNELDKRSLYTRATKYLICSRIIEEFYPNNIDALLFCNIFYLHRTEEQILKKLYKKGNTWCILQGDPEEFPYMQHIGEIIEEHIPSPFTEFEQEPQLECLKCFDTHSQIAAITDVLKKIPNPDDTVVVVPQAEKIIPLLSQISSVIKECNVSLGYPLNRSALFNLVSAILKAQETRKGRLYYRQDYLEIITHPLIRNLIYQDNPDLIRNIVNTIEGILNGELSSDWNYTIFFDLNEIASNVQLYEHLMKFTTDLNFKDFVQIANKVLERLHQTLFRQWEDIDTLLSASKCLDNFVAMFKVSEKKQLHPLFLKMLQLIETVSLELKNSNFSNQTLTQREIFLILKYLLEQGQISFRGSPLKGLQILGFFETRALNFSYVIVMDAQESILPKVSIYEPLIPREVMISLGLNRLEQEEQIQHYHFSRLISYAKKVWLVYEEGEDKEKSRFVEELLWKRQKKTRRLDIANIREFAFRVSVLPEKDCIKKTDEICSYLKNLIYSPTSLTTYLHCPRRFYFHYVLRLQQEEKFIEEPTTIIIGNFIHQLFEEFYRPLVGKKIYNFKELENKLYQLFNEKFTSTFERLMRADSFLLKEVIRFRLEQFIRNEEMRDTYKIIAVEKTLQDKLFVDENVFSISFRVDRIDELKDSSLLALDYKTSLNPEQPKEITKIERAGCDRKQLKKTLVSFQLPFYFLFLQKVYPDRLINAAIYHLAPLKINFLLKKLTNENIFLANQVFSKALKSILKEIINKSVNFDADEENPYYCKNCPFVLLCR
ncbi:MAG: PD-(D/E)XK nuclease family protein [Candidatus Omnitrophica bacterium]|nr:PD-(D/E)XK nuclease family protein [Candidatus Omnitrophota bacterium]